MASRLLIVENRDPAIRLLEWGLSEEGFTVFMASPEAAIEDATKIDPHCVVINIEIVPRGLVPALREAVPDCHIIGASHDSEEALDGVMTAPFTVADLAERVRGLCQT